MMPVNTQHLRLRLLLLFFLTLWIVVAAQPGAAQDALPTAPPDGAAGLETFEARCANCHGPLGAGDGELAPNLTVPPQDFTDPAFRQTADPATMFDVITFGVIGSGMPPFGPASSNPIAEQDRWDLVAAVYSLATPAEAIEQGRAVFEANCVACHGDTGQGDGPEAAAQPTSPADLTQINYWFSRSNEDVFNSLAPDAISAHTFDLPDEDLWAVVDYARTFSYTYIDPQVINQPIPAATISGKVLNGTTGVAYTGVPISLRAFTPDFSETMALTATLDGGGSYQFDVTNVPPNWLYITSVPYGDLSFNSNVGELSAADPTLDLPITVFDTTNDPSAVSVGQLHVVLEFLGEDRLRVNELYVFDNDADKVFVGESGDATQGTVEIALPAGAENVNFQRSFGSLNSFLPAEDLIQTATGWADRLPIRPGPGALTLLARYELPYQSNLTIAHPLNYPVDEGTLILADAGVKITGDDWTAEGPQQFETGEVFLNYSHPALAAGEAIAIELDGRPRQILGAEGTTANRDQTTELLIGAVALLLVGGAGLYLFRTWQTKPATTSGAPVEIDTILRAIADLDDAYAEGRITTEDYQRQRDALKQQAAAVWGKQ